LRRIEHERILVIRTPLSETAACAVFIVGAEPKTFAFALTGLAAVHSPLLPVIALGAVLDRLVCALSGLGVAGVVGAGIPVTTHGIYLAWLALAILASVALCAGITIVADPAVILVLASFFRVADVVGARILVVAGLLRLDLWHASTVQAGAFLGAGVAVIALVSIDGNELVKARTVR